MTLTAGASWLNGAFAGYDQAILSFFNAIACKPLTLLFKLITLIGEKGLLFFVLALALMCFSRTRKLGVCLFGAVACGALITNIVLKDMIARPRPFETNEMFRGFWNAIGSPAEDGYSFPSGHVTAAAAGMTAISLMKGKKWILPSVIWVLIMMAARNYLMAHYPSDVLAGALVGVLSGFIAYYITLAIFSFLKKNSGKNWAQMCLEYDLPVKLPSFGGAAPKKSGAREHGTASGSHYVGKHEKR